ncbi:hypothetical protein LOD99_15877 [Oopsacas minuta]|uniref:RING-type domain-containing protein n=1 Tax=Oopsacas minuta TaxID=111878 RepID=A0AAV7K7T6_9METZ|nr:hypothetical protein LOD99_15877 [Oopsacas minuta]
MEYSVIEGKKIGSVNYECQSFRYIQSSSSSTSIYLRCTLWRCKEIECHGTGRIHLTTNLFYLKKDHNHPEASYESSVIVLNNRIKRAAESSTGNLREIFDDVTSTDQAGALVSYRSVRNTMVKRRRLELPGNPLTPEQFEVMIKQTRFSHFFRTMIISSEGFAALFWSDFMFESLKNTDAINFDATFFVVPKLFYQLFTIFLQEGHHALPAIHILMSKKSESLYDDVLQKVREFMPDFKPKLAVGDYERASRNSFRTAFNSIEVSGCLFHFSRAIWKRLTKLHLTSSYTKNSEFNGWVRSVMVLPMLPEEEILPVYRLLSGVTLQNMNDHEIINLQRLKSYIKREWINRNDLSISHSIQTTNNCSEVYHRGLKSLIRVKKPSLSAFMECLEKTLKKYDLEYQRMKNDLEIGERSAKDINNEKIRNKCKEKLQRKECTSLEYIKEISNTIGNPKFWTYSGSTELEESIDETSDSSSDEESMVKNPCIICLNSRDLTFVFIPCGHANVCGNCELNFTLGDRCPVCRSIIMNKMQIFQ